ncbi:MAG TPA: NRDE family protein [Burkholderiaceae bacterium]|nr:NRDE family protein [Burkholderiaceae bacterium]
MCLVLIAWQSHPDYPLIVAANRDEFYARKTRAASWWGQSVSMLSGRDEEAGGTWLGFNRQGRFCALTHVRLPTERNAYAPSRGGIVVSALQSADPAVQFSRQLGERAKHFNGFNLLTADVGLQGGRRASLVYTSNRLAPMPRVLMPGIYGLSNAFLDTPWPKVTSSVARFSLQVAGGVDPAAFFRLLADRHTVADGQLPSTGVSLAWERALSAVQVRALGYGTRSSTVLTVRNDGLVSFIERSFDAEQPDRYADRHYEFVLDHQVRQSGDVDLQSDH